MWRGNEPRPYPSLSVPLRALGLGVGVNSLTRTPVGPGTGLPTARASSSKLDRSVIPATHVHPRALSSVQSMMRTSPHNGDANMLALILWLRSTRIKGNQGPRIDRRKAMLGSRLFRLPLVAEFVAAAGGLNGKPIQPSPRVPAALGWV